MYEAVLFDLDDTLYDEQQFVMGGFHAAAKHLENKMKLAYYTQGRGKVFDYALKTPLWELIAAYRGHEPDIQLYPDVIPVLAELKEMKYRLGIITDGHYLIQMSKISALKLAEWMDVIVYTDRIKAPKPAKDGFLLATNTLKVKSAVYVGNDPLKDFDGPLDSIQIARKGELPSPKANYYINKLTELKEVL